MSVGNNQRGIGLLGRRCPRADRKFDKNVRKFAVYIHTIVYGIVGTVVRQLRKPKPRGAKCDHRYERIVFENVGRCEIYTIM